MFKIGDKIIIKARAPYSITAPGSIGVVVRLHSEPGMYDVNFSTKTGREANKNTFDIQERWMDFYCEDGSTATTTMTRKIKSLSIRWANQQAKKGNPYALYLLR